jgi:hypothetical protein
MTRHLTTFANRVRDFARFAQTNPDLALPVTDHDEGTETETSTTFNDLRRTVDVDNLLHQLVQWLAVAAKLLIASRTRAARTTATESTATAAATPAASVATAKSAAATTTAVTGASHASAAGAGITGWFLSFVCHSCFSPVD